MQLLVCVIVCLDQGKWKGVFLYSSPPFSFSTLPSIKNRVNVELDFLMWICSGACEWDWLRLHGIHEAEVWSVLVEEERTVEVMLGNLLMKSGIKLRTCIVHVQAKIRPGCQFRWGQKYMESHAIWYGCLAYVWLLLLRVERKCLALSPYRSKSSFVMLFVCPGIKVEDQSFWIWSLYDKGSIEQLSSRPVLIT